MWLTSLLFLLSLHLLDLAGQFYSTLYSYAMLNDIIIGASNPQGLTLLTATSCICPGRQLMYECTVVGPEIQFTVWKGNALDCSSGEISLRHGEFMDMGHANGTCNGGNILARITSYSGDSFTSQLIVNTSLDLNGREIQCAYDNGRDRTVVNASTITLTTGWCLISLNIETTIMIVFLPIITKH